MRAFLSLSLCVCVCVYVPLADEVGGIHQHYGEEHRSSVDEEFAIREYARHTHSYARARRSRFRPFPIHSPIIPTISPGERPPPSTTTFVGEDEGVAEGRAGSK